MSKILYIQPTDSTFMNMDYEVLKCRYLTDRIVLNQSNKFAYTLNLIKMILNTMKLKKYDMFVSWFADYHSALAALMKIILNKKLILFIGGYDAVDCPAFKIGVYRHKFRSRFTRFAIKHADLIIANHESLIEHENTYISNSGMKSGLKNIIHNFTTPYEVIYNGVNIIAPTNIIKVQRLVVTCGVTPTWEDLRNKGYDLLIEAARKLPEFQFVFIGISDKWLPKLQSQFSYQGLQNLTIFPKLPQKELHDLFAKAQIYAQPSISEGMPNALMEAMIFECIPVGSDVAGIPTLINEYGIIIKKRDVDELVSALQEASELTSGKQAAEFIKCNFSVETRVEKLQRAFSKFTV